MTGIRAWISATSSLASVVIIANVRIHSPDAGSFQFSQMPARRKGAPSFMAIAQGCFAFCPLIAFHSSDAKGNEALTTGARRGQESRSNVKVPPLGENSSKLSLSYLSKLIMDQTKTSATRPIGPPRSSRRFVGKRGRTDQQPEFTRYVYPDDHQRLQVVLQSADASHAQQCCRRHHCGAEACSGGS